MLNSIIKFALRQRLLTIAAAIFLLGYGSWQAMQMAADSEHSTQDSFFLRGLKWVGDHIIRFSLTFPRFNLTITVLAVALAGLFAFSLDRDFLPPFNEGSMQLNVVLPPGTSLATSNEINKTVEQRLLEIDDVDRFV